MSDLQDEEKYIDKSKTLDYNYNVIDFAVIEWGEKMALRDHSLDDKIAAAAFAEFLDKGYTGASLRKIAEKAGVTVGAIQIRYKSKDELFASLVQPLLEDIQSLFQSTKADYYTGMGTELLPRLKASMQHESAAILRLIFDHYEQAVLLLCRSAGSSLEHCFDGIVQRKIDESIAFFRSVGDTSMDETLLGFLISAQFDSYRRIVLKCANRKAAEAYMDALMTYHFGGWTALFAAGSKLQEGSPNEV